MTRRVLLAGVFLGLCSCGPPIRFQVLGPDFGKGLGELIASFGATYLTAQRLCERTQPELLATAGEPFEFSAGFVCPLAVIPPDARRYHIVGFALPDFSVSAGLERATLFPASSDEELVDWCKSTKEIIGESTRGEYKPVRLALYFSAAEHPVDELVRLDFVSRLESGEKLAITCESATLVDTCNVRFVEPPCASSPASRPASQGAP